MTGEEPGASSAARGYEAYDRASLDRFFAEAGEERGRLLAGINDARGRIASAEAALRTSRGSEKSSVHAILEAQRLLREEVRANERAVAAIRADAAAEAQQVRRHARMRTGDEWSSPP